MRTYRLSSVFAVLVIIAAAVVATAGNASGQVRTIGASTRPIVVTTAATIGHRATASTASTAKPRISLSRTAGPPTTRVRVTGSGFGAFARVDVYVDSTDTAVAGTGPRGRFGPVTISVPAAALPGRHWISAKGHRSRRFAQRAFTVRTNWAGFHYSTDHAGSNPHENVLNPGNVSQLEQAWSFDTSGRVDSSPAVVNGVVYAGSGRHVYALDAASGAERWAFRTGAAVTGSSPAVAHGTVYIGTSLNGTVYALNAATGAKRWSFETTGGQVTDSPAVANGVVYIGNGVGLVYALNAGTGKELWSHDIGATSTHRPRWQMGSSTSAPRPAGCTR